MCFSSKMNDVEVTNQMSDENVRKLVDDAFITTSGLASVASQPLWDQWVFSPRTYAGDQGTPTCSFNFGACFGKPSQGLFFLCKFQLFDHAACIQGKQASLFYSLVFNSRGISSELILLVTQNPHNGILTGIMGIWFMNRGKTHVSCLSPVASPLGCSPICKTVAWHCRFRFASVWPYSKSN